MSGPMRLLGAVLVAAIGLAGIAWTAVPPDPPTGLAIKAGSTRPFAITDGKGQGAFVVTWNPAMTGTIPPTPWTSHLFSVAPKNCSFADAAFAGTGYWQRSYAQGPYEMELTCTRCGYPLTVSIFSQSAARGVKNSVPAKISGDFMPCPAR